MLGLLGLGTYLGSYQGVRKSLSGESLLLLLFLQRLWLGGDWGHQGKGCWGEGLGLTGAIHPAAAQNSRSSTVDPASSARPDSPGPGMGHVPHPGWG